MKNRYGSAIAERKNNVDGLKTDALQEEQLNTYLVMRIKAALLKL